MMAMIISLGIINNIIVMNAKIENLIQTFLVEPTIINDRSRESIDVLSLRYSCQGLNADSLLDANIISIVDSCDQLVISVLEADETSATYDSHSSQQTLELFKNECSNVEYSDDVRLELSVTIYKNCNNGVLNIYDYSIFYKDLSTKKLLEFLNIWNLKVSNKLVIKVHSEEFKNWRTSRISFKKATETVEMNEVEVSIIRDEQRDKTRKLVYSEFLLDNLLPPDLEVDDFNTNDPIARLFVKAYFFYSAASIFDFSSISEDKLKFKINGFKTREFFVSNKKIEDLSFDLTTAKSLCDIYNWAYVEGNTYDKIVIARNILSINLVDGESIILPETTFSAIQSNYRYYTKENAKSFITLRNELSKILLEQENKVSSYVADFASDFKRSILPSVTFFISVIAIRTISNQDIFDGFSPNIMKISWLLVFLSIANFIYSLFFDLNRKLHLAERQIKDIRNRYKELLTDKELDRIFYEGNDCAKLNCFVYARKQRLHNALMWIVAIVALSVCLFCIGVKHESPLKQNITEPTKTEIVCLDSIEKEKENILMDSTSTDCGNIGNALFDKHSADTLNLFN